MKIALMKEGFGHPTSDRTTYEKVRGAIAEFSALGATVDEVSVPMHYDGPRRHCRAACEEKVLPHSDNALAVTPRKGAVRA